LFGLIQWGVEDGHNAVAHEFVQRTAALHDGIRRHGQVAS